MKSSVAKGNLVLLGGIVALLLSCILLGAVRPLVSDIQAGKSFPYIARFFEQVQGRSLTSFSESDAMSGLYRRMLGFWSGGVSLCFVVLWALRRDLVAEGRGGWARVQFALIILFGLLGRLLLAGYTNGNFDMGSWQINADIAFRGGNVYAETWRYDYSPIWFTVLGGLKWIELHVSGISFSFLVRAFLTLCDLLTLILLLRIAHLQGLPANRTALLFFLNPVSLLCTGYHGQFENVTVLLLLAGAYVFMQADGRSARGKWMLWISATFAMCVKHLVFPQVLTAVTVGFRRRWVCFTLFALSGLVFLSLFIPYVSEARGQIFRQVFFYSSIENLYGITLLFAWKPLKYLFILGLFIYPFCIRNHDLLTQFLLGFLFFLTFTTGIGDQYFVLPIALGALRASKGFLVYTVLASLFILGSPVNIHLHVLSRLNVNVVWIGAIFWFVTEQYEVSLRRRQAQRPVVMTNRPG